ncbi:MAG: HAMP domain-containing histidine kinase [Deltaproteobacteria bacterium]|nr:HAMP domain-containing histidine kinase [Deltaproteobacteria bacterium]
MEGDQGRRAVAWARARVAVIVAAGTLVSGAAMGVAVDRARDLEVLRGATEHAHVRAARHARSIARLSRAQRVRFHARAVDRRDRIGIAGVHGELWPGSIFASVPRAELAAVLLAGEGVVEIEGTPHAVVARPVAPAAPDLVVIVASPLDREGWHLIVVALGTLLAAAVGAIVAARVSETVRGLDREGATLDALAAGAATATVEAAARADRAPRDACAPRELRALRAAIARLAESVGRLEERRASAELARRHADRAKTAFLATVSHELRTPLQAVLGFADVLLAGIDGPLPTEQLENVRVIRSSGDYLLTLVNDVLDLSALASGSLALGAVRVDVAAAAEEVVAIARGLVLEGNAELRLEVADDTPMALADPTRVRQVLHNLVGNAIKHAGGQDVVVQVHPGPRATVEVLVRDGGPGIVAADLERIFEPYQRLSDAERTSGVGLGLTIARALVERQGGTIGVESEPGRGTTFTARWPSADGEA